MATTLQPNQTVAPKKATLAKEAASRIKSVDELNKWLRMVVYGRNKTGKTHFAGSSERKTLIIDCEEKGTETLLGRKNCDVFELSRWEELDWIYWHLRSGDHPYEVAAIDTVTMLSTLGMKFILGEEFSMDSSIDPKMPDRRHYGKLNMMLGQAIIDWRNLPMHILFLAQERTDTSEDESDSMSTFTEIVPSLTKGPRSTLLGAVGTIGRLYTREVTKQDKTTKKQKQVTERRMLVGSSEKFAGGTRIKGLPRTIINPNLEKLLVHREKYGEMEPGEANPDTALELS